LLSEIEIKRTKQNFNSILFFLSHIIKIGKFPWHVVYMQVLKYACIEIIYAIPIRLPHVKLLGYDE